MHYVYAPYSLRRTLRKLREKETSEALAKLEQPGKAKKPAKPEKTAKPVQSENNQETLSLKYDEIPQKLRGQITHALTVLIGIIGRSSSLRVSSTIFMKETRLMPEPESRWRQFWGYYWSLFCQEFGLRTQEGYMILSSFNFQKYLATASTEDFLDAVDFTFQFAVKEICAFKKVDENFNASMVWSAYTLLAGDVNRFFLQSLVGYQLVPYKRNRRRNQRQYWRALWIDDIDSSYPIAEHLCSSVDWVMREEKDMIDYLAEEDNPFGEFNPSEKERAALAEALRDDYE